MCSPMAAIGVASLAFSAYGSIQESRAASAQAKYEQAVQRNNDVMAQRAQEDALDRGKREEVLRRMQITQDVGTKKSAIAASGFDVNTGSALTAQSDIAALGDAEALTIRDNAARDAYQIGIGNYSQRANSEQRVAGYKNDAQSSLISGATSVLSTGFSQSKSGIYGKGMSNLAHGKTWGA